VNSANTGDVIIVDPGTYTENVLIDGKTNLLIRSSADPANTVIAPADVNKSVIVIQNSDNVTIQGLKVTGAGSDKSGIYVYRSYNCKVEDNILHNDALGVYLKGSDYTVVRNNTATKDLSAGRAVNVEQSNFSAVLNNKVSNQRYGIYISDSRSNTVSGNTVNLSTDNGIHVQYATNISVENNNLNSNGMYGILLSNSNDNFLRSNNVFNSTNNSIEVYLSSGNEISGNIISDSSIDTLTHGIHLNTAHNNVLRNNIVSNNDYGIAMIYSNNNNVVNNTAFNNNRGIYLALTSSINTISDSNVYSNINGGIVLQNCSNNNIVNNEAKLNTGSSTTNGIILGGANNNNVSNNDASGNRRGIYITSASSGNTVSGNTLNSNTGHGILLENAGSNNNLSRNTISSNGGDGIYLVNSNNTYLLNNVAPNNNRGIEVSTSYENVISNNTASNNAASGIRLSLSNNNTISGNTVYNDTYGIESNSSRYNTISSNNITRSRTAGMFLCPQSTGNLIFNNYLNNSVNADNNNNLSTWNVTKTPGRNIVNGPYIGGNYWADPVLKNDHSQIYANNDADGDGIIDTIYTGDSLIDYHPLLEVYVVLPEANFNTNVTQGYVPLTVQFTDLSKYATGWNWDFGDGASSPDQNTMHTYTAAGNYTVTLTASNLNGTASKTAVITALQPDQGGNESTVLPVADFTANVTSGYYPLTVLFTDTSQNSISRSWDVNGDGVEDSNEASFVYTYNYRGTYTAKLTAINANGTNLKTATINVDKESSGGSSGGGGGGGSPEPAKNVEVKELSQVFVSNGKAIQFDFTKNATCVVYLGFDAKKTVGKTTTIAEQLKNKSTLVSNLSEGEVYKYFNVWVGNSGFASSSNIENPEICFKVEKSWLTDKKIDQDSIALNRYSDKKWEQLPVSLLKEDSKYLYFTADVPGYTFFAITGNAEEAVTEIESENEPADEPENSDDNTEDTESETDTESDKEENTAMPGFEIVFGIASLSAAFLYRRK
jgi:PGF-pre-PGF domain-containing protein